MATDYRMTIRTDFKTADAFRDLAYEEELSLGDMLGSLLDVWQRQEANQEVCTKLMAMKYNGSW